MKRRDKIVLLYQRYTLLELLPCLLQPLPHVDECPAEPRLRVEAPIGLADVPRLLLLVVILQPVDHGDAHLELFPLLAVEEVAHGLPALGDFLALKAHAHLESLVLVTATDDRLFIDVAHFQPLIMQCTAPL